MMRLAGAGPVMCYSVGFFLSLGQDQKSSKNLKKGQAILYAPLRWRSGEADQRATCAYAVKLISLWAATKVKAVKITEAKLGLC